MYQVAWSVRAACAAGVAVTLLPPGAAQARPVPASAFCGASVSDPRFAEASALCAEDGGTRSGVRFGDDAAVADPSTVAVAIPAERRKLARAERAVLSQPNPSAGLIAAVGQRYGVDPRLLAAMVRSESGGRVGAVSRKGALGLMQVMPATARSLGVADPAAMLADPALALSTGAAYLKTLQARLGNNVPLVVAAYNAGPGAVLRAGLRVPAYAETRGYVGSVVGRYAASLGVRP